MFPDGHFRCRLGSSRVRLKPAMSFSCAAEQAARRSTTTMKRTLRLLNMEPEQVARRAARQKKQNQRKTATAKTKRSQTSRRSAAEHARGTGPCPRSAAKSPTSPRSVAAHRARHRRLRPCCGLRGDACTCKPPPGLHKQPLNALAKRYGANPPEYGGGHY